MQGYKKINYFLFVLILICLTSCDFTKTRPPINGAYAQIQTELRHGSAIDRSMERKKVYYKSQYVPRSVSNALLPPIMQRRYFISNNNNTGRFDVSADQVPAKTFFMGLVEGTPYNMIVDPNIAGTITLKLKNVTILQTLQAIRDVYGYDFHRTAYGYEIFPPTLHSRMFTVNYLNVKRLGKSVTTMTSGEITQTLGAVSQTTSSAATTQQSTATYAPISNIDTSSELNFWKDLEATLLNMVGTQGGRSIVVSGQSGVIVVRAYPAELRQVEHYLNRIQTNMTRQVILEAKILEVQLNDQFQSGINWNMFGQGSVNDTVNGVQTTGGGGNQYSQYTFPNTDLQDFNAMFSVNIVGDFGALIKLLQTQGNVQVLSSPRISTVNNQKAVIKVGDDQFYVTNISSTTTVSGSSTIPTQSVTLTPFFSGITLDVTPEISGDGMVILHIHPAISNVTTQTQNITVGNAVSTNASGQSVAVPNTLILPLAKSTIRETDDIVRARNGQIVVIGGLMQNIMTETTAGTPGVAKIPFLGALFRRTQQISRKVELVVLLRPILATNKAWIRDMDRTSEEFNRVHRGYHVGGLPEVFGDEGEKGEPTK